VPTNEEITVLDREVHRNAIRSATLATSFATPDDTMAQVHINSQNRRIAELERQLAIRGQPDPVPVVPLSQYNPRGSPSLPSGPDRLVSAGPGVSPWVSDEEGRVVEARGYAEDTARAGVERLQADNILESKRAATAALQKQAEATQKAYEVAAHRQDLAEQAYGYQAGKGRAFVRADPLNAVSKAHKSLLDRAAGIPQTVKQFCKPASARPVVHPPAAWKITDAT
jgi:hypothetical protein